MQEEQDNWNHCLDSIEDHALSGMFLKPLKNTRSMCFIGSETSRLRLVVLNPIESYFSFSGLEVEKVDHAYSFFLAFVPMSFIIHLKSHFDI